MEKKMENEMETRILQGDYRFFWWLNLVRLYSLYEILYPKKRI